MIRLEMEGDDGGRKKFSKFNVTANSEMLLLSPFDVLIKKKADAFSYFRHMHHYSTICEILA
jgi:hypothetical protein